MNNIRIARKAKGLTQKELAAMVGVTQGNLSSWETDRWKPDIDTLKKLCEILECSADYLLGQVQPKQEVAYETALPVQSEQESQPENIYFHLAKEMEAMQLPPSDIEKILDFARYMKEKNDLIGK